MAYIEKHSDLRMANLVKSMQNVFYASILNDDAGIRALLPHLVAVGAAGALVRSSDVNRPLFSTGVILGRSHYK